MFLDYVICQKILWEGSRSFAAASLLMPSRIRWPASAIYAFCRWADDSVDVNKQESDPLSHVRARLEAAFRGRPHDHPVDRVFSRTVQQHEIPRAMFDALLEGFGWDLARRRYDTISDLMAYSARVASSVGVMMSLVMNRRDPVALARACDLGAAMQLTNIARDVGEDARAGRVYLPLEWLEEEQIDPNELLSNPRFSYGLGKVVERLLQESRRLYQRAESGIGLLPWDCRPTIAAARLIYAEIGEEIRNAGYDSISRRVHTSGIRKIELLLKAAAWAVAVPPPDLSPPLPETSFLVEACL